MAASVCLRRVETSLATPSPSETLTRKKVRPTAKTVKYYRRRRQARNLLRT